MEFQLSPEDEAFRQELRQFLREEVPPEKTGGMSSMNEGDENGGDAFAMAMRKKLAQRGWLTMGWPKEYGGQDASPMRQTIFMEEMAYWDAPGMDLMGVGIVGPTIMRVGSDAQKRQHLHAIAKGEVIWSQGFSEPGAGSDLASLQTRADLKGDVFVVNGQKIWSSGAHRADYMYLMARTDQDVPKHKGISVLLVDLKSTKQGLNIRPIINMAGMKGFNEVFFDNMEVPRENLLGELNQGWYYSMGLLESERTAFINFSAIGRNIIEGLTRLVNDPDARGIASGKRPETRAKLADATIENKVARNLALTVTWMTGKGIRPTYQASVAKVFGTEAFKRLAWSAMSIVGLYGQVERQKQYAPLMGRVNSIYYTSVGMTIAGGASEIQRNVIATRGLGLPR
ncbi:MAG: acyl-CoA dehydrogenase family protein [Chloroflexi bacterium]|nr:acyl-CoA dehydrogenase family protein [Chloroflexota bacterium]